MRFSAHFGAKTWAAMEFGDPTAFFQMRISGRIPLRESSGMEFDPNGVLLDAHFWEIYTAAEVSQRRFISSGRLALRQGSGMEFVPTAFQRQQRISGETHNENRAAWKVSFQRRFIRCAFLGDITAETDAGEAMGRNGPSGIFSPPFSEEGMALKKCFSIYHGSFPRNGGLGDRTNVSAFTTRAEGLVMIAWLIRTCALSLYYRVDPMVWQGIAWNLLGFFLWDLSGFLFF
jgi:hypothetical protein